MIFAHVVVACHTPSTLLYNHAAHFRDERWAATVSTLLCLTAAVHSAETATVLAACMGLVFAASTAINDEQQGR